MKSLLITMTSLLLSGAVIAQGGPPDQILSTNMNIFDVTSDKLVTGRDVLVENNLIKKIGKKLETAEGSIMIDGGGRTLTPGFIDAHTHLALIAPFEQLENEDTAVYVGAAGGQMAENMLMRGFTTMIELARKHELKIALGSDTFLYRAAYDLQAQEWVARAKLFSSVEIMKQATSIGTELAELAGARNRYREGALGVIEEGAYADIVLVEGNPLEAITLLADPHNNLKLIMKDGVIYKNTLVDCSWIIS